MRALMYNTISDINFIYSAPSINATILSIIKKGVSLSIDSIDNGWASFTTNNTICYIKESDLKLSSSSSGTITIKYIDEKTNEEIKSDLIKNALPLGEYNFAYEEICGYILNDDISKKVILDENNKNKVIFFKYKKNIADELLTIYYVDSETNESIYETKNYTSNTLSDMCNTTVEIPGYDLLFTEITSSLIKKITYKYRKNTGSIKIIYMDENSEIQLSNSDEYIDLELGKYEYTAKNISGFSVIGNKTQSVILSYDNNNITLVFNYKEDYLPLDINEQNKIPYISTYYIKPIVSPNEDVIINFYITDYYQKEYIDDNFNELFTVTIKIDCKPYIIKTNLKAGDHSINIGNFCEEKEQKFSIICTDKYGRNSQELFNYFWVRNDPEIKEYTMVEDDLKKYNIKNTDDYEEIRLVKTDLTNQTMVAALTSIANITSIPDGKYICFIGDSNGDGTRDSSWSDTIVKYSPSYDKDKVLNESTLTREGIQRLLDDKKSEGYNRINFLNGTYRIDHLSPIYIPSNFTVDLNNSTIKLNSFTGNKSLMFSLNNTIDSHLINGIIEGDYFSHDYTNSTEDPEWVNGISIEGESKYSSFENLIIQNITGYGSCNGIANSRDNTLGYNYTSPQYIGNTFKLGDIDKKTGLDISSTNRTTSDYIDITKFLPYEYLSISVYLGYQGNPCNTWNILCHFYDCEKKYITSINSYQFRKILIPTNSTFLRVTILSKDYPTNLTVNLFRIPTHCSFKYITHKNCRCVGMAQSAMNNMLVDSCIFTNCGQYAAKCAYDAEDGWDMMQDATFKNLNFYNNPNSEFLTCAGHNFIIDNLINGKISTWKRCRGYVIKNSTIQNADINFYNMFTSGYRRFYNNTITKGIVVSQEIETGMVIKNCNIRSYADGSNLTSYINCNIENPTLSLIDSYTVKLCSCIYKYCYISNFNSSYHKPGIYIHCTLKNIRGRFSSINGSSLFKECELSNIKDIWLLDNDNKFKFEDCTINDCSFFKNYWDLNLNISFINCKINIENYLLKLPHYSVGGPIDLYNNIIYCNSTLGLIYFYDDRATVSVVPQNTLTLKNNVINLTNSPYIILGLNKDIIHKINIISINNSYIPNNILLYDPDAKLGSNINIIEE